MASSFFLQIVDKHDGTIAKSWEPGRGVEQEFIALLVDRVRAKALGPKPEIIAPILDRIRAKGVGVLRTEAHVIADVEAALREYGVGDLRTAEQIAVDVEAAIREYLYDLKAQVRIG